MSGANEERAELEEKLDEIRATTEGIRQVAGLLFDDSPEGVVLLDDLGRVELNEAARRMLNATQRSFDWSQGSSWGLVDEDGEPVEAPRLPCFQALRGETPPATVLHREGAKGVDTPVMSMEARPAGQGASISVLRDITDRMRLRQSLEERAVKLAESEAENAALIERLRAAIDQIANPVIRVAKDVLVMPIIGVVDTSRSGRAAERLLEEVSASRARWVIIDVTGVELMDTTTADLFSKVTRAVQLLGCRASISGMQPAVARTMVDLGISLDDLPSHRNLRQALEATLPGRGIRGRTVSALPTKEEVRT